MVFEATESLAGIRTGAPTRTTRPYRSYEAMKKPIDRRNSDRRYGSTRSCRVPVPTSPPNAENSKNFERSHCKFSDRRYGGMRPYHAPVPTSPDLKKLSEKIASARTGKSARTARPYQEATECNKDRYPSKKNLNFFFTS